MPICPNCRNIVPVGMTRCDVCNIEISSIPSQSQQCQRIGDIVAKTYVVRR